MGKITCASSCPTGQYQDSSLPKSCKSCPSHCSACDSPSSCTSCGDSTQFLGTDKITCSANCQPKEYKDLPSKTCIACSANCLECDQTSKCLKCEENFVVRENECVEASKNQIDYLAHQVYDQSNQTVFTVELVLENQAGMSEEIYKEVEAGVLDFKDKFEIYFSGDEDESGAGTGADHPDEVLVFNLRAKIGSRNQFFMVITPPQNFELVEGKSLLITINSFSKVLNPSQADPEQRYSLEKKSTKLTIKKYKEEKKLVTGAVRTAAEVTGTTNKVSIAFSLGVGLLWRCPPETPMASF